MYTDRLRELKYISPSGTDFTLQFDGLNRSGGKKAPVSEFPGQDQGAVQDLGEMTISFPITCYLSGSDYDTEADKFWDALAETGPGKLVHPRWGNLNVLPSTREQKEQFVNGAGRAVFTILFLRVNDSQFEYPTAVIDSSALVVTTVEAAVNEILESLPEELTDPITLAGTIESIKGVLGKITGAFDTITGIADDIRSEINQTVNDIMSEIDSIVSAPAQLMESMLKLYRMPASIITNVEAKIAGYKTIYTSLASGFVDSTEKYGEMFGLTATANLNGIALATAEATTTGKITTRTKAGEIVESLNTLSTEIKTTIEAMESSGNFSAGYEMQRNVNLAISSALNGLIDQALNLPTERVIILDREMTPLNLVWELYGDIERLDDFIEYNNLCGDEILWLTRGKEVRWYV